MVYSFILNDGRVLADLQSFESGIQALPPSPPPTPPYAKLVCPHFTFIQEFSFLRVEIRTAAVHMNQKDFYLKNTGFIPQIS